jgi:pyruvate dehydrogenase complex dehydrogenase (E1) component
VPRIQLLRSGTVVREAPEAASLLERAWNIAADVWSVRSFTELRRSGLEVDRWNRLYAGNMVREFWVEQCLRPAAGLVIAASDCVRAVPDLSRPWILRNYVTLGIDGFGLSDTRRALRRFFEGIKQALRSVRSKHSPASERSAKTVIPVFMARYTYEPTSAPPWYDHQCDDSNCREDNPKAGKRSWQLSLRLVYQISQFGFAWG